MTVLQAAPGECTDARENATHGDSWATGVARGAPAGNDGAASEGRGRLEESVAVSVRKAIEAIDSADLEGARKVLAALLSLP